MAWIRVTDKWEWRPNYGTTIVYKPGVYNVPRACATLAIAAGKAVRMTKSRKDEVPVEKEADEAPPTDVGGTDGDERGGENDRDQT